MAKHKVLIKSVKMATHNVIQITTEKPLDFDFQPGQATEIFLDKKGWEDEGRPFTFTSLPTDDYLEFTIKTYPERKGVTNELLTLKADEHLFVNDIFGEIGYKEEGIFIAGGAGITPFIAIFRELKAENRIGNNKLIFANKSKDDIIYEQEFANMLDSNFINVLSADETKGYEHGYITEDLIKKYSDPNVKNFYLCGPPPMMDAIEKTLSNMKVDEKSIIKEGF